MKILVLSDNEDPYLWDYYTKGRLDEYDLILSAGDLKAEYLSFLVTMAHVPVFYVHGNHDTDYEKNPPEGCDCIEDRLIVYKGLRILGLGGCAKYKEAAFQYTEREMKKRIRRLFWKLRKAGGVDIVLSHVPPKGFEDMTDYAHRGFASFLTLIDKWHPSFWIHGHTHLNYGASRAHEYHGTQIINAWQKYVIEAEPDQGTEQIYQKKRLKKMRI